MKMNVKDITEYIFVEPRIQKADLLFVFGTRHKEAILEAYNLYKQGLIPKILISGGINRVTKKCEARDMKSGLIKLGVKAKDIILEDKATNSLENVLFSKMVIEDKIGFKNVKKLMVLTKDYHSRRALMTIKKHFPKNIKLCLAVYNVDGLNKNNWFNGKKNEKIVLEEYSKIKEYLNRGDIEELNI